MKFRNNGTSPICIKLQNGDVACVPPRKVVDAKKLPSKPVDLQKKIDRGEIIVIID